MFSMYNDPEISPLPISGLHGHRWLDNSVRKRCELSSADVVLEEATRSLSSASCIADSSTLAQRANPHRVSLEQLS